MTDARPIADRKIPAGDDFLSQKELAALTPERLIARMRDLSPEIAAAAREVELQRKPSAHIWSALRKAGYFYLFVPKAYGGLEATTDQFIDATLPIAEACTSTGWVASFCAEHNWFLTHFPKETQDALFGGSHPYVIAPGVTNPPGRAEPVEGGYRITAHWKWGTGIIYADWVIGSALVEGAGKPRLMLCLVPAEDVVVPDSWQVSGMAGTASHDILVTDCFVPHVRTTWMDLITIGRGAGSRHYQSPHYDMPILPFLSVTASISALGAARAAACAFREALLAGARGGKGERPALHMRLGKAEVLIAAAETIIRQAGRDNVGLGSLDGPPQLSGRIRLRAQVAQAVSMCREAVSHLGEAAGSSAQVLDNPIQRAARDINTISTHIVYDLDTANELVGRDSLGLPPNVALV